MSAATPTSSTSNATTPSVDHSTSQNRDLAANFAAQLANQGSSQHGIQGENGVSTRDWALLRDPVVHTERLEAIRNKKGYIIDMDGVIYHVSSLGFNKA